MDKHNAGISISLLVILVGMGYTLFMTSTVEGAFKEGLTLDRGGLGTPAGTTYTHMAFISLLAINSADNQVLLDYAGPMDIAGIDSLAEAHQTEPIPEQDLLVKLPSPLAGWTWAIPGGLYITNSTFTTAAGSYFKGTIMSYSEMVQVAILHQVGGFSYEGEEFMEPPENVTFDAGYPRELTIQGYQAWEWRASGANAAGFTSGLPVDVDSVGMLYVILGAPIPEIGSMVWSMAALFSLALVRKRISS